MNKTFKGLLAAVLVLGIVLTAVLIFPATAAENAPGAVDAVDAAEQAEDEEYTDFSLDDAFVEKTDVVDTGDPGEGSTEEPTQEPTAPAEGDTDTVGDITTIKRTTNEANTLGLSWNAAAGADGYHVYWRYTESVKDFVLLSTVKGTSLTIRNLKAGHSFQIKIVAYKTKNGSIVEGKSKTITAATIPTKVKNFHKTKQTATATTLAWNKVTLCDGYILYRKADGVWSRHQVLDKDTTSFTDKGLKSGKAYYYNICAYRKDSGGTVKGDTVRVNTVAGLSAPANNGTKILLRKVYLNWTSVKYANGYDIFYSTNDKDYKELATTTSTSFITHRLKDDRTYYFKIYPYRLVGTSKTKVYGPFFGKKYKVYNSAYGKKVPSTYIEVSLDQQHMWYYINDELYVSTPVVTGNYGSMGTPRGYWAVNNKASPCTLSGPGYTSYVQYWMSFIGSGWGIHDASWRSSFGGQIYKGNGSHGCINTPYNAVQKMYRKVKVGTPVIVY